ncbi:MAG: YdcF family protein [Burkholderiaceae bacterium]
MNELFVLLDLQTWKPVLTALLLPPVPLLLLALVGARLLPARRGWGWLLILAAVGLIWLSTSSAVARLFSQLVLHPPPALSANRIKALGARSGPPAAIVVLGGGAEALAPEYGVANLRPLSMERLRYGVWLSRATGLPLAFSGGVGWGQRDAEPEAQIAARIAAAEFARPLRWIEDESRDTRGNAMRSVSLLRAAGIRHIVVVTHGWHMPRAMRAFELAAGADIRIEPAPMGMARPAELPLLTWMPSATGATEMRHTLRELLGRLAGA